MNAERTAWLAFMCFKCRELDKVIAHYRELREHVTDRLTLEGIDLLIKKRALHLDGRS